MNKLAFYGYSFRKSFTSLSYYNEVVKTPLSRALKFYCVTFLLFSLLGTLMFTTQTLLPLRGIISRMPNHIISIYPDDLIISINRGQVTTNVNEPYVIPYSMLDPIMNDFENSLLGKQEEALVNLFVIDTNATPDNLRQYKTWSLLSWNTFSYINKDGHVETVRLDELENVLITKEKVVGAVDSLKPFVSYIFPLLVFGTFLVFIMWGLWLLVYLFAVAFFYWLTGKIAKRMVTYKQSYQIALHLIFIPIIIFTLLGYFGLPTWFPFRNLLVMIAAGILVIPTLNKKKV